MRRNDGVFSTAGVKHRMVQIIQRNMSFFLVDVGHCEEETDSEPETGQWLIKLLIWARTHGLGSVFKLNGPLRLRRMSQGLRRE